MELYNISCFVIGECGSKRVLGTLPSSGIQKDANAHSLGGGLSLLRSMDPIQEHIRLADILGLYELADLGEKR